MIGKIIAGVIVLILVLVAGFFFYMDTIAKEAIEQGGAYATGVETNVGEVQIGPIDGTITASDLRFANPRGFPGERFLFMEKARMEVRMGSLLQDKITVPTLVVDGIQLNVERKGVETNVGVILDRLQRLGKGDKPPKDQRPIGVTKRWVIKDLALRDIAVQAQLAPELGQEGQTDLAIPEIVLHDVGTATGGVDMVELTEVIIKAILDEIAREGMILEDIERKAEELGEDVTKQIEEEIKGIEKELRKQLERLEGLPEGNGQSAPQPSQ